jgi:hypothetical protein
MANQFLNEQTYSNVMLLLLKNQLTMGRLVDGRFKNEVTDTNGLTTSIKRPPQYIAKDGPTLQKQDLLTGSATVAVDQYKNVHMGVGDLEAVQSFNALMRDSNMKSAASTLAHEVNGFLASKTLDFYGQVGTVGETIKTTQQFNKVHTQLMRQGVPNSDLSAVLDFEDSELIRGQLTGSNIDGVNKTSLERTRIPMMSEIDSFGTQALPSFTSGDRVSAATTLINGAAQNVNYRAVKDVMTQTLNVDGQAGAQTFKAGETFTIAGVFQYDNRSHNALPQLQVFTIVADAVAAAGVVALTISPPIIVPGTNDGVSTDANTAFGNVSAAPADGAAVTHLEAASTTYRVRTAFHKRAIAMVSAKLESPFNGKFSFAQDPDTGISIRYWRGSDINTGEHIHRWDMIYGATNVQPSLGARVWGAP